MNLDDVNARGLVLLGCGKMGSAMLEGWLNAGISPDAVSVLDPYPSDWLHDLAGRGLSLNADLPDAPAICFIAVKPQMMGDALPRIRSLVSDGAERTVFVSIAAGIPIASFKAVLGDNSVVIRAMPNTPAAVGKGITAIIGDDLAREDELALAQTMLSAIGQTLRLENEGQMDAVTAVSGSGPAYVFHLIETLAAAGLAEGLPKDMAMQLALATVAGAGALAETADDDPAQLRINVTSPAGTTAAALDVLMDRQSGFPDLLQRAVHAAAERSRELAKSL